MKKLRELWVRLSVLIYIFLKNIHTQRINNLCFTKYRERQKKKASTLYETTKQLTFIKNIILTKLLKEAKVLLIKSNLRRD